MAAAILFALFFLPLSHAQTIRPVISEYTAKVAKGSIELVNPGLTPLTVIIEPKSFSVSETGDITYRPLDRTIQLKLSAMSFQIPPQQSYFIFYELAGKTGATQGNGFPLFPHSTRIVQVPCNQSPTALRLRLRNFKMEEPLPSSNESQTCAP